ncbi:hypothetical protein LTR16_007705, partial [Cryomyces antarcticus]
LLEGRVVTRRSALKGFWSRRESLYSADMPILYMAMGFKERKDGVMGIQDWAVHARYITGPHTTFSEPTLVALAVDTTTRSAILPYASTYLAQCKQTQTDLNLRADLYFPLLKDHSPGRRPGAFVTTYWLGPQPT